ncbi:hypothetical protein BaRGS_00023169, partial [Batillaria attramentaria]
MYGNPRLVAIEGHYNTHIIYWIKIRALSVPEALASCSATLPDNPTTNSEEKVYAILSPPPGVESQCLQTILEVGNPLLG